MPKVTIIQVVYNNRPYIERVFQSVLDQTFKDFRFVSVIAGDNDKSMELIAQKFPEVEIIDPGYNIGFAKGHNMVFEKYDSDFFQLVNPDLILQHNYIEEMLKVFEDKKVGAVTGKLLRYDFDNNRKTNIIDTTGVTISKSGRARDRGQHEVDNHRYDALTSVQAVSGAGAMYRRTSIEAVKTLKANAGQNAGHEYFDEDFHSYWEDVDLSWRMANSGWKNVFVPSAVGYHGRSAGSSEKGYADVLGFIAHHRKLSPQIRQLNYKNHMFMYIKNSSRFYPQFFIREFFMLLYILMFEPSTLKVVPEMFKLFPIIWEKRRLIKKQRRPESR